MSSDKIEKIKKEIEVIKLELTVSKEFYDFLKLSKEFYESTHPPVSMSVFLENSYLELVNECLPKQPDLGHIYG
jgi:hypothetical protein